MPEHSQASETDSSRESSQGCARLILRLISLKHGTGWCRRHSRTCRCQLQEWQRVVSCAHLPADDVSLSTARASEAWLASHPLASWSLPPANKYRKKRILFTTLKKLGFFCPSWIVPNGVYSTRQCLWRWGPFLITDRPPHARWVIRQIRYIRRDQLQHCCHPEHLVITSHAQPPAEFTEPSPSPMTRLCLCLSLLETLDMLNTPIRSNFSSATSPSENSALTTLLHLCPYVQTKSL